MTRIECDQCGRAHQFAPGEAVTPLWYGLRDFGENYTFCSSRCRVEWMRVRGELAEMVDDITESIMDAIR